MENPEGKSPSTPQPSSENDPSLASVRARETRPFSRTGYLIGTALVTIGLAVLLANQLRTGWLALVIFPVIGLMLLVSGIVSRKLAFIIPGSLITFLGAGALLAAGPWMEEWPQRIGMLLIAFAMGWAAITLLSALFTSHLAWWALIPFGVLISMGLCFLWSALRLVDFVLFGVTSVGLVLLGTGIYTRLFGLIIPGSLLLGIGPGIFLAWGTPTPVNGLVQTGIMLVWFSLGWGLITLFSRVITDRFTWWPLIPAGVLIAVGWGLYIGGNSGEALSFIGNTGSIGLIIFGLYLLLLRRGIHR